MTYYNSVVLADSPVVYYKLDEASGTPANAGSSADTATKGSSITQNVTGINGGGKAITSAGGVNGYVSSTLSGTPWSDKVWSIEWWMKGGAVSKDVNQYYGPSSGFGTVTNASGKLVFTIYGGTTNAALTSATTVTGSTWHHIVVTSNGNDFRLYVDGTQEASSTTSIGTFAPSTTLYLISNLSTTGGFTMDEFAFYDSALSSGRVSAHYSAGNTTPVDGGFTAAAMTASATAPTAVGVGTLGYLVTKDSGIVASDPDNTVYGTTTNQIISTANGVRALFATGGFSAPTGQHATNALFEFHVGSVTGSPISFNIYRIDGTWSESTVTWTTKPAMTLIGNINKAITTGWNTLDITSIVSSWLAGTNTNYGIALEAVGTSDSVSIDTVESGSVPYIYATYASDTSVNPSVSAMTASATMVAPSVVAETHINGGFTAGPLTASALMVDPAVATQTGTSVSAAVSTASATMVDPAVTTERFIDVGVSVETFTASADMPGGEYAAPVSTNVGAMAASADIVSPSVSTTHGVIVTVPSMLASAAIKQPAGVNGQPIIAQEVDDKYFNRVMSLRPKNWFRLNDSIYAAHDRIGTADGTLHGGVFVGQHNAPDNRHSFHFDGSGSIEQTEPSGTNVDENTQYDSTGIPKTTLDFSFRTTKPTQFLMAGKDDFQNPRTLTTSTGSPREVALKDGKITYRTYNWDFNAGRVADIGEFSGFKNLADGEWHSVSIRSGVFRNIENGIEIWVDGKLEIRRVVTNKPAAFAGFPDWIGGRPDAIDGFAMNPLGASQWFEGDLSEVVWYDHLNSDDATTRLYYDFMGWSPIEAAPMEAFAFMTDGNRGKGNQKRALVLKWYEQEDMYQIAGDTGNNKMNFDPLVGYGEGDSFNGYKLFWRSVDDINGQAYRDPVTDRQTLIDLELDVDIHDYDVIMFRDWPDEGFEFDSINYFYGREAYERLLGQLRWANNLGVGLFITHPRLAADLGIVDRVDLVPTLEETAYDRRQGNAQGLYDYGSAAKFPWNIASGSGVDVPDNIGSPFNGQPMNTDPNFLSGKAFYYGDTNKNDRFRVRALIEGLTDIPSYMITDAIYQRDFSQWGWDGVAYKYIHRLEGMHIGDEYIYHGTDFGYDMTAVSADYDDVRVGRWYGSYAAPISAVKAGTVVTSFGATLWQGKQEVDNPYKEYATSIVLKPGDVLAGIPVQGRIYVNFTEQPSRQPEGVVVQVLPTDANDFPRGYHPDTAAQREWEYSFTRTTVGANTSQSFSYMSVVLPNGEVSNIQVQNNGGGTLTAGRTNAIFPMLGVPSWQMNKRGLFWLSQAPEHAEGDKTLSASAATATASMPSPTVTAQHAVRVPVQPALALGAMTKVAEDESGDADTNVLPMTAEATMTGYSKNISVGAATATAEMIENFDLVHATGEQVVLTLHGVDVTLFLKEEV